MSDTLHEITKNHRKVEHAREEIDYQNRKVLKKANETLKYWKGIQVCIYIPSI